MSPSALGPAPYTRAVPVNGRGPVSKEIGALKGGNRVFAHFDDLVNVVPAIDKNSPLRTILQRGEEFAKHADTSLDFRRPDVALSEHIKATIVAVDIIPRHKDYPALQSDRGDLHRMYTGLVKRIQVQSPKLEAVKSIIKENNAINGVRPGLSAFQQENLTGAQMNGTTNGHTRTQSDATPRSNGILGDGQKIDSDAKSDGSAPRKMPPIIQPKPEGLHGKVLAQNGSLIQTDLQARFARLRTPEPNSPIQDPRIRTQPILIPDTSLVSSNELPFVPTTLSHPSKISLDVNIADLPRPPDAIYSPARGTDNAATANLPSSIPRGSSYIGSGRKDSAPPISNVGPTPAAVEPRQDYFVLAHSVNTNELAKTKKEVPIPASVYISAEDLFRYQSMGSQTVQILLVDLRSRDNFDSGHIRSQSIICVEPVSLHSSMSGDELAERMVIGPDAELSLFMRREEFDLIVFYDQSSTTISPFNNSGDENKDNVHIFSKAVWDFAYEKRLKRRPMLLMGGLDAWVDLMGENSLMSTVARKSKPTNSAQEIKARSMYRIDAIRGRDANSRRKVESRPLTRHEESKWDETLKNDRIIGRPVGADPAAPDEQFYVRTADDFLRRFPDITKIQESMTTMAPSPRRLSLYDDELISTVPAPTRPPPALPRQRSSGISERGPSTVYAAAHAVNATNQAITKNVVSPGLSGLSNPGVLCYMNSLIQMISSIPEIRNYFLQFTYPPTPMPPRTKNEDGEPPMLMSRNLTAVLKALWSGQYNWITPRTFAAYVNATHLRGFVDVNDRRNAFGGSARQHDPHELLMFLLGYLHDELNTHRDVKPDRLLGNEEEEEEKDLKLENGASAETAWMRYQLTDDSIISQHLVAQTTQVIKCNKCGRISRRHEQSSYLAVPFPEDTRNTYKLRLLLATVYGPGSENKALDRKCNDENCQHPQATRIDYISALPKYLILQMVRFSWTVGRGGQRSGYPSKIRKPVRFDDYDQTDDKSCLDLTNSFLPMEGQTQKEYIPQQNGKCKYKPISVVVHEGAGITSGHYYTIAKQVDQLGEARKWHKYNDEKVTKTSFDETQQNNSYLIVFEKID